MPTRLSDGSRIPLILFDREQPTNELPCCMELGSRVGWASTEAIGVSDRCAGLPPDRGGHWQREDGRPKG
jgi:hypothetical protein